MTRDAARPADPPMPTDAAEPARVALVVTCAPLLALALVVVAELSGALELAIVVASLAVSVGLTWRWVVVPLRQLATQARMDVIELEVDLLAARAERDFRSRLERALRISETESTTLRTGLRAVAELMPDAEVALLLNVPDEPRVGWRVRLVDGALEPAEPMPGTPSCTALSDGSTSVTDHSGRLDACAHLRGPELDMSAVCVPLRLGERLLGSICVTGAPGEQPDAQALELLEWTVERIGVRAAEQRQAKGALRPGPMDPITGLPGPVTLKHHLRDLVRSLSPFCVAIVDIDDLAELIDHGADDDSLCLLAEVLCATLRPDDLVCRLEGGRFAAVLAQCSGDQATAALERARESLVLAIAETAHPAFTCSVGVVESHRAGSLDELVELAGSASARARAAGGNRVVIASEQPATP